MSSLSRFLLWAALAASAVSVRATPVTFIFDSTANGLSSATYTAGDIGLTISNPSGGTFTSADAGLYLSGDGSQFSNGFDLTFDHDVTLTSYVVSINFEDAFGTAGTFSITGGGNTATSTGLDTNVEQPLTNTLFLSAGTVATLSSSNLTGSAFSGLILLQSITIDDGGTGGGTTAVPEPGTTGLLAGLAVGAVALGWRRSRQRAA